MAVTYKPKIEPIKDGRCTQTIRKGRKFKVGDSILIHGWEGKPYRSKWDWRKRITLIEVINCHISNEGIMSSIGLLEWDDVYTTVLADNDYIHPATGSELRNILFKLNGAPSTPEPYQILRW